MKTSLGQMDGNTWEEYCHKLLGLRYTDYQKVPARFGGDLGIDGFTFSGFTFQCYSPDDDPYGKDLYRNQRKKITGDIGKLIKNVDKISALGPGVIKGWHFLTPNYNSRDLITHCRSQESRVKGLNLSAIYKNFRILLQTEDTFLRERQQYLGADIHKIQPSGQEPPPRKLDELLYSDNEIVSNIKRKIAKLSLSHTRQTSLTKELVSGYIVGRAELDTLNRKFPSTFQSIILLKSAKQSQLSIRSLSNVDNTGSVLNQVLDEYEAKLSSTLSSSISDALITRLSTEAIADWLGRCPLDF